MDPKTAANQDSDDENVTTTEDLCNAARQQVVNVLQSLDTQTTQLNQVARSAIKDFVARTGSSDQSNSIAIGNATAALEAMAKLTDAQTSLMSELRACSQLLGLVPGQGGTRSRNETIVVNTTRETTVKVNPRAANFIKLQGTRESSPQVMLHSDDECDEEELPLFKQPLPDSHLPPPPGHDYDNLTQGANEATPTLRKRRQSITPFAESPIGRPEPHMINHGGGQFVFSVGQYNLLADYVGSNYNYWFLYGADLKGPEGVKRRQELKQKFYALDEHGNRGVWPEYATGILTEEEIRRVEEIEAESFLWENRVGRLSANIASLDVDILSLVELDHYEDHFRGNLAEIGYDSVYVKRPRKASKDGCGVFWKRETFYYVAHSSLAFVDEIDSETNRKQTDRCCLCVLLRTRYRSLPILFVSVHLARNPENPRQDALRGKQLVQLLQLITSFTQKHKVTDAPVIVCGDINATSISKIRGIAGAAAITAQQRIHPFLWRATDVPSLPTSVTSVRKMRVDTILFLNTHLQLVDVNPLPTLSMDKPIPNEEHPSDHLPIKATFKVKSELKRCKDVAREWWAVASGEYDSFAESPLDEDELRRAFMLYDYDGSNSVDSYSLSRGIGLLQLFANQDVIDKVLAFNQERGTLHFDEFCVIYLSHERFSHAAMSEVFDWLDRSKTGFLSKSELYQFGRYFKGTALEMTPDHILSAINLAHAMASPEDLERGEGISREQFMRLLMLLYARLYFSPKVARMFKTSLVGRSLRDVHKSATFSQFPALTKVPSLKTLVGSPRSNMNRQATRVFTKNQRLRLDSIGRQTCVHLYESKTVQSIQETSTTKVCHEPANGDGQTTTTSDTSDNNHTKEAQTVSSPPPQIEVAIMQEESLCSVVSKSPSKRRRRGSVAM